MNMFGIDPSKIASNATPEDIRVRIEDWLKQHHGIEAFREIDGRRVFLDAGGKLVLILIAKEEFAAFPDLVFAELEDRATQGWIVIGRSANDGSIDIFEGDLRELMRMKRKLKFDSKLKRYLLYPKIKLNEIVIESAGFRIPKVGKTNVFPI
jgi:hypothetical protein